MITLSGKGVYGGIVIGRLCFYKRENNEIPKYTVKNVENELIRFESTLKKAISDLKNLYKTALKEIDKESAAIFEIHGMMLEDEDFNNEIIDTIKHERINAEYAIFSASVKFSNMFESMDDSYMQARGADIRDISNRLISILLGKSSKDISLEQGDIICADDLTPSEAMSLDRGKVSAFVTSAGSASSHTAILAKSMGIPAVIGVGDDLMTLTDGAEAIVDGFSGKVYISPDAETSARMKDKRNADLQRKALLEEYKGLENITLDGKRIELFANIQCLQELPSVTSNDAGGIGLFRSEFLYMDRKDFPTEDEQYEVYKKVLSHMESKKVIIRTLDIGADKQADYFMLDKEENPALGLRAIRICLTRPDIFRPQLRALLRASVHGNLGIMFPMISSVSELKKTLTIVDDVKRELTAKGIPFCTATELGIMIETPAAAIISDILAPLVDFFSIGTNDLTQYTLALDRQNRLLDRFFEPHHEAVLRLIELTVNNAHAHGKWVGICGELGADVELTERFLRMGIDELSVSPSFILPLRDKIRKTNLQKEKGIRK
ncbi:MAG: phosphoenolpyruvate--protein phosphotransferase [Ruminococcaceae bacterium]|nr:phosphoenolpyruvate--protein phosphotransferase [Oscillospiraceae bacterium]